MTFEPTFTITNSIANALTSIERVCGFLEAADLSKDWINEMQNKALILEAHYTTHIEGTQLTLKQSEKLLAGELVIKSDIIAKNQGFSDRQKKAIKYLLQHDKLTIQKFEKLYPKINRRSLQRDLKNMVDIGILITEGSTHHLVYKLHPINAQLNSKIVEPDYIKKQHLDKKYTKLRWSKQTNIGKYLKQGYEIICEIDATIGNYYKLQQKNGTVLLGKRS